MEPGVVLAFKEGTSLHVRCEGSLNAVGTENKRIIFRGEESVEGFWQGLQINSGSDKNKLNYCDILHTGSVPLWTYEPAALKVYNAGSIMVPGSHGNSCPLKIQITNCTIKKALGYGIIAGIGSDTGIDSFYNNIISVNGIAAMSMPITGVNLLDTSSVFESNGGVGVKLTGQYGDYSTLWESIELIKLKGNPVYLIKNLITNGFHLNGGLERYGLVIEKGVEIRFAENVFFEVEYNSYISANGTADEPIIFTGANSSDPQWDGIIIASKDSRNKLEHCEIRYGGANAIKDSIQANIFLGRIYQLENEDPPSLILKNCIIEESGGCGIQVQEGTVLIESNNTFLNNLSGDKCD